jgi:hypothetical protein
VEVFDLHVHCIAGFIPTYPAAPNTQPQSCTPSGQHGPPKDLPYIRIVSKGRIIYRHPTGGRIYGKGETRWERERKRNKEMHGGNYWAMWETEDEWESAKWMATTKVSQSSINRLLKTKRVSNQPFIRKLVRAYIKSL